MPSHAKRFFGSRSTLRQTSFL